MSKSIGKLSVILTANTSRYTRGLDRAGKKTRVAGKRMKGLGSAANVMGGRFASLVSRIKGVPPQLLAIAAAAVIVTAGFAALAAVTKKSIATLAPFDKALSRVEAVSGATSGDMGKLQQEIERLGKTTEFTAVQAAEAAGEFAKAGFRADEIFAALGPTLSLASAGEVELAEAAKIAAGTMNSFGLQATDVVRIVDVLAIGATSSATTVSELGEAIQKIGPVAKLSNQSLEQSVAALQVLADNMIVGSDAGTALRNVYLRLQTGIEGASAELDRLGVEIENSNGVMKPLATIVDELNVAMKDMSGTQRVASATTIAGTRAVAPFLALLDNGGDVIRDATKALGEQGKAAEVSAKKLDNLSGDVTKMQSAFSGAFIAIGKMFEPQVRKLIQSLTRLAEFLPGLIDRFSGLIRFVINATTKIVDFTAAVSDALNLDVVFYSDTIENVADGFDSAASAAEDTKRQTDAATIAAVEAAEGVGDISDGADKATSALEEAETVLKRMESKAKAIFDATRTPAEKLAAKVKEIGELAFAGLLDPGTVRRALAQARGEFGDKRDGALRADRVETRAVGVGGVQGKQQAKIERLEEKQLAEAKKRLSRLEAIRVAVAAGVSRERAINVMVF